MPSMERSTKASGRIIFTTGEENFTPTKADTMAISWMEFRKDRGSNYFVTATLMRENIVLESIMVEANTPGRSIKASMKVTLNWAIWRDKASGKTQKETLIKDSTIKV